MVYFACVYFFVKFVLLANHFRNPYILSCIYNFKKSQNFAQGGSSISCPLKKLWGGSSISCPLKKLKKNSPLRKTGAERRLQKSHFRCSTTEDHTEPYTQLLKNSKGGAETKKFRKQIKKASTQPIWALFGDQKMGAFWPLPQPK